MEQAKIDSFIASVLKNLQDIHLDVSDLEMDHIGYQASSDADYEIQKKEFDTLGKRVSEEIVGGRRVGIYELFHPLHVQQYTISAIELIAPKASQVCPSALEHVEFVLKESFALFMEKYPALLWDTSAIDQPDFPMIKLKLGDYIQVKFHLESVLIIIDRKKHGHK